MSDVLDPTDPLTWPYWMKVEELAQVLRVSKKMAERLVTGDDPVLRSVVLTSSHGAERLHRRICRDDVLRMAETVEHLKGDSDDGT